MKNMNVVQESMNSICQNQRQRDKYSQIKIVLLECKTIIFDCMSDLIPTWIEVYLEEFKLALIINQPREHRQVYRLQDSDRIYLQTFNILQKKSLTKNTFIIISEEIMNILALRLLNEQSFQRSVMQSEISTSAASVQSLPNPSLNKKIQNKTSVLNNQSPRCRATSDVLEREVMIWFALKGIHEGFPQQLLQDQNLLQRRQINSQLHRKSCEKSSCQLGKRVGYKLHISV